MNTIVFPESVVGKESAGAYVRADEARDRITELEQQLADMTELYHTNNRCECGDDEACQHVRRIQELEKQLSLYQGGVEVGAIATLSDSQTRAEVWLDELSYELVGQRVRVLVIKEVE